MTSDVLPELYVRLMKLYQQLSGEGRIDREFGGHANSRINPGHEAEVHEVHPHRGNPFSYYLPLTDESSGATGEYFGVSLPGVYGQINVYPTSNDAGKDTRYQHFATDIQDFLRANGV